MPQTWMITGANRGIGLAITIELLRRGDRVIAAARNPWGGALAELAAEHPADLIPLELDVTSDASVAAAREALVGQPIDVLLNNAGLYGPRDRQKGLDVDFDAWREVFEVNVYAPIRVAQAFLPNVEAGQGRKIATISSRMAGVWPTCGMEPFRWAAATGAVSARLPSAPIRKTAMASPT